MNAASQCGTADSADLKPAAGWRMLLQATAVSDIIIIIIMLPIKP
jgi:hypothetical protein